MRQAGVLAAAGLYALENNIERLAEDHENAKILANALADAEWAEVDLDSVETNIVRFNTPGVDAVRVVAKLAERGVNCGSPTGPESIRIVTCLEVTRADILDVCGIIRSLEL